MPANWDIVSESLSVIVFVVAVGIEIVFSLFSKIKVLYQELRTLWFNKNLIWSVKGNGSESLQQQTLKVVSTLVHEVEFLMKLFNKLLEGVHGLVGAGL